MRRLTVQRNSWNQLIALDWKHAFFGLVTPALRVIVAGITAASQSDESCEVGRMMMQWEVGGVPAFGVTE